ncbi:MAG: hypothetical protein E3K32_03920 [wastewater metagenome]|nr:hypothetical protein [Candidatus Loosdrechtia aerotolerans]
MQKGRDVKMKRAFVIPAVLLSTMSLSKSLLADTEGIGKPSKTEISGKIQKLQMPFISNEGQVDERVKFYANTFGGKVFVTKDGEIVYSLPKIDNGKGRGEHLCASIKDFHTVNSPVNLYLKRYIIQGNPETYTPSLVLGNTVVPLLGKNNAQHEIRAKRVVLKEEIVQGRINTIEGEEKSVTEVNYFKGNDPSQWKSTILTYEIVNLGEIYKGIDLKLKAYGNNVEKLFYISPDTDPGIIQVKLSGANALRVNKEGQLEAETVLGTVTFTKPVAYQEIDGKKVEVAVEYRIQETEDRSQNTEQSFSIPKSEIRNSKSKTSDFKPGTPQLVYGFKVASYDKARELVIDPLFASTYLGGGSYDRGYSLALDRDGNVYVTGSTESLDFPTTEGAFDTSYNFGDDDDISDIFVSKLNSDLTKLRASTYLGGGSFDRGYSLALDRDGNVYVTGHTSSSDFPTTKGAFDTSLNSRSDAFVSKLNSDLTKLRASTFLGGNDYDLGYSIALDGDRNVYVIGETRSSDFPTTEGAFDTSFNGGLYDAFVSKLKRDLTKLRASTFLGGNDYDHGYSIALDGDKNVYVTGRTQSSDFPTTEDAFDTSFNGGSDVFVLKLNKYLTKLRGSTFLGGESDDYGQSLALGSDKNVYVTGRTQSSDFPTTEGAFDTSFNGGDAFVSKLNKYLTKLRASTFLGEIEDQVSIALDSDKNVYVTGRTRSSDFPTTEGAFDTSLNGDSDAFVSKLNKYLTKLRASTFLGGNGHDHGYSIALDGDKNVYVTGITLSSDFPTTEDAFDTSLNGDANAFISKLDRNLSAP